MISDVTFDARDCCILQFIEYRSNIHQALACVKIFKYIVCTGKFLKGQHQYYVCDAFLAGKKVKQAIVNCAYSDQAVKIVNSKLRP